MKGVDTDNTSVYSNHQIPLEVSLEIANYRPPMSGPHWAAIEEVVRASVLHYGPEELHKARRHLRSASKFALWVWQRGSIPLEPAEMFTYQNIERFMQEGASMTGRLPLAASTRHHIRSQLEHISTSYSGDLDRRRDYSFKRGTLVPYTRRESAEFSSWAAMQPTPLRFVNAHALLGLAEGAGLHVLEIAACRVGDISLDAFGAVVAIRGSKARAVPVDEASVSTLQVALEDRNPDDYVYQGNRNRKTPGTLVSNADWTGSERPQAQRLRATWIIERLNANVPVKLVLEMAGIGDPSGLKAYLPFVTTPDKSEWRRLVSRTAQ
jgi:hypothetical protein